MSKNYENSIFWIEVDKVQPNPYQPRRDFDEERLKGLADSIRQYGVLQPLVVTRSEIQKDDGGISTQYELIAGERRLRASKIAGLQQVPVVIRIGDAKEEMDRLKLELAIIENVQREDLNPIDRARAFKRLVDEFHFKHVQIAHKVGKSREYVSNSVRLLALPEELIQALSERKMTEGHARPLLMLSDHPDEQATLFKEILIKKLTVREAERIARHTASDRVRKRSPDLDPEILELEQKFISNLGTRVQIECREEGGKITIDFYNLDDLHNLFDRLENQEHAVLNSTKTTDEELEEKIVEKQISEPAEDGDLYSIKNFTI